MNITNLKFGYKITDCDYSQEAADVIRYLASQGRFVLIKNDEALSSDFVVSFYNKLGLTAAQPKEVSGAGIDGNMEITRVKQGGLFAGGEDGELEYHSAGMNRVGGDDLVAMYMYRLGDTGGNTFYTDGKAAYNDLDDETKELLHNVQSKVITYDALKKMQKMHYSGVFYDTDSMMAFTDPHGNKSFDTQVSRKNVATQHPITKEWGLHFPWSVIRGFSGLDHAAQHELYYRLKEHTLQDKYVYEHVWSANDLIISDQHHSLHKRAEYTGDRELWRAGIWFSPENIHENITGQV